MATTLDTTDPLIRALDESVRLYEIVLYANQVLYATSGNPWKSYEDTYRQALEKIAATETSGVTR